MKKTTPILTKDISDYGERGDYGDYGGKSLLAIDYGDYDWVCWDWVNDNFVDTPNRILLVVDTRPSKEAVEIELRDVRAGDVNWRYVGGPWKPLFKSFSEFVRAFVVEGNKTVHVSIYEEK